MKFSNKTVPYFTGETLVAPGTGTFLYSPEGVRAVRQSTDSIKCDIT